MLLSGCSGNDWQARTYPTTGQVMINGAPPAKSIIKLEYLGSPADSRELPPFAIVRNDGTFTVTTYKTGDGAPLGEYAITIRWPKDLSNPESPDRLLDAFSSKDKAITNITITKGENIIPPIDLTGVKLMN